MFSLVSLIRRSVDYSVHENWRFIVIAMNAPNKTPDHASAQDKIRLSPKIPSSPVSSDTTPPRPSCSASTASASLSSSCFAVMARSPAPFHSTTAAHSARQAAGRPLPALAGQRSAFLPTARRAPFSDNAWKAIVAKPQDRPPTIAFSHYQKRPSIRSTGRGLCFAALSQFRRRWGSFVFVNLTAPPLWIESRCHALSACGGGW